METLDVEYDGLLARKFDHIDKMDPEWKAKWLTALRSGQYAQGVEALQYEDEDGDDRFCCLGVLCDLAKDEGLGGWKININGALAYEYSGDENAVFPPATMDTLVGFGKTVYTSERTNNPLDYSVPQTIAELNDAGHTFEEIADWIEANL